MSGSHRRHVVGRQQDGRAGELRRAWLTTPAMWPTEPPARTPKLRSVRRYSGGRREVERHGGAASRRRARRASTERGDASEQRPTRETARSQPGRPIAPAGRRSAIAPPAARRPRPTRARGSSRAAPARAAADVRRSRDDERAGGLRGAAAGARARVRPASSRGTRRRTRPVSPGCGVRQRQPRPHDGQASAHASAATGGAGTSFAMNVRHHIARLSRYQRFAPSAVCITRLDFARSSRSVSAQKRRSSDSAWR